MNALLKASVQTLNSLFNHLSTLGNTVLWMRNGKYDKQLFISANYESVWQRSCESLYESPNSWSEWLMHGEQESIFRQVQQRTQHISLDPKQNTLFYRIKTEHEVRYMKDCCFPIVENTQLIAYVGLAEQISSDEWHQVMEFKTPLQNAKNQLIHLKHNFIDILAKEFQLHEMHSAEEKVLLDKEDIEYFRHLILDTVGHSLTSREIECCYYLCFGKSAKEIAQITNISFRTVEKYLENAIKKTHSSRRTHLVQKLSRYFFNSLLTELPGGV